MVEAELLDRVGAWFDRSLPRGWEWRLSQAGPTQGRSRFDAVLTLISPGGRKSNLPVELKGRALPAEIARELAVPSQRRLLLSAPRISERARRLLQEAGVSWLELESGDCRIEADDLFIERLVGSASGRWRPEEARQRYVADLFSGSALRIVRRLLIEPERTWKLVDMAGLADVTPAFVSRVFATLERDAYLSKERGATRLKDREALLDAWTAAPAPRERRFERVFVQPGILSLLPVRPAGPVSDPDYALTAEVAAEQIAPFASWRTIEMYVRDVKTWDDRLRLQSVPRGGNHVLIVSSDPGIFDGAFAQGLVLASRPQVYVDLKRRGGAAGEAADFLRKRGELWPT